MSRKADERCRAMGVAAAGGSAAGAGGPASKFRGQTVLEAANRHHFKVDAVYGISEKPMSAEEWKKQFAGN